MGRIIWRKCGAALVLGAVVRLAAAQAALPNQPAPQAWTWEQVKDRLELNNPTLLAGKLNISEMQADEITAHLRPNPNLGLLSDQIAPINLGPEHGPFAYLLPSATVSYLYERAHKREFADGKREEGNGDCSFAAGRSGARPTVQLAQRICTDAAGQSGSAGFEGQSGILRRVLKISSDRYQAGTSRRSISIDWSAEGAVRSDVQTAIVNLRTAKSRC